MLYVALLLFHEAQAASTILGMLVLVIIVDEASAVLRRWVFEMLRVLPRNSRQAWQ